MWDHREVAIIAVLAMDRRGVGGNYFSASRIIMKIFTLLVPLDAISDVARSSCVLKKPCKNLCKVL
jgi:hypothetical protein